MTDAEERIRNDLAAQIKEPVRAVRAIPEGHSGFTYWVELDGRRGVLRLPPPGARIAGPADIPRQARIMAALHDQGLPVPFVMATSEDPVVDGRPFVLMEAVPSELTGQAPRLANLLLERQPHHRQPVLVHGDYHFGNMLFEGGGVAAVVDWEIAQLGQPLLDLCCISLSHVSAEAVGEMYRADPNDYRWYRALTYYKYASIFGYNLMLHRRGKRPDPSYEQRTDTILEFIDQGIGVLG